MHLSGRDITALQEAIISLNTSDYSYGWRRAREYIVAFIEVAKGKKDDFQEMMEFLKNSDLKTEYKDALHFVTL